MSDQFNRLHEIFKKHTSEPNGAMPGWVLNAIAECSQLEYEPFDGWVRDRPPTKDDSNSGYVWAYDPQFKQTRGMLIAYVTAHKLIWHRDKQRPEPPKSLINQNHKSK